jgi:hypothetical protein
LGTGIVEHFSQKELQKLDKRNSQLTEKSESTYATTITNTPLSHSLEDIQISI